MGRDPVQHKVQVWIVNRTSDGDEVLLFRVIAKRGGGWHPVTGSVEEHESRVSDWLGAAKRETREETGIPPEAGEWIDLDYDFEFDGRWGRARERAYALLLQDFQGEVTLDPSEHEDLRWVALADAGAEVGFESQRLAWKQLRGKLGLDRD